MVVPTFVIAGAAKGGTSSITRMVGQHPDVFMAARKETHYFLHPERPTTYAGPGDDEMNKLNLHHWDDYEAMFEGASGYRAIGEASVFYMYSPEAVSEMRRRLGDARVVVTLRDPARRAWSAYSHLVMRDRETLSFEDALAAEPSRIAAGWEPLWFYRSVGRYADQVESLFDAFGRDRVLALRYDDFKADSVAELRKVFAFLDVDPSFTPSVDLHLNSTGHPRSRLVQRLVIRESTPLRRALRPLVPARARHRLWRAARDANLQRKQPDPAVLAELTASYREDVHRLERLLGWDLAAWR